MLPSWLFIGGITLLISLFSGAIKIRDTQWGVHLRRPNWLFFEPAIPFIWTFVFICGSGSAILVWEKDPGNPKTLFLMAVYLILEIITVAYIPLTLKLRSLKVGLTLGGTGVILGILLTLTVWSISGLAAFLLLPYLLWSPVGTYTTWQMMQLNPEAA